MQFKHPEILWALFLLLIPILIHLFQLRRFKKTPFTNVAMLQRVVSESRKSNTLKKWLLLCTRLLLLVCLIIAFAQPFSAAKTALQQKETVVYLDDSFSMQAKANGITLLEKSVQDLLKSMDKEQVFSLFTNQSTFKNISLKDIQNNLLSLPYSHKQLTLDEIELKGKTLFSKSNASQKNLILISDFQERLSALETSVDSSVTLYYVSIRPKATKNIAIDSAYVQSGALEQTSLTALLSGGDTDEASPISLYNGDTLIAKTSAKFKSDGKSAVEFSIPANKEINGRLQVTGSDLNYDNQFYFNINKKEKIRVLAIGSENADYLSRLYTPNEFILSRTTLNQLDYSIIDQQNVVLLNGLTAIPNSLQQVLRRFKENGGTLIIIPSEESNLTSYNQFLSGFFGTKLLEGNTASNKKVTTISFGHPLYKNVFERQVYNFQYPFVNQYFNVQSRAPKILSLDGNDSFLVGNDGFYLFTASLADENTNFKNSPLIVPTLYNMAAFSLKTTELYHTIGESKTIDVSTRLSNDNILSVSQQENSFIPLQQSFPNKVSLTFEENPASDGIFTIANDGQFLKYISFNYPREESQLRYMDLTNLPNIQVQDSIPALFDHLDSENSITAYWKWFVILALLLALIEVIIQKFIT
ncbi:BatA domain-containing protein [Flagellimonas sp. S3867]|uniref:BatA domain-containing protein n=1 Tax=Flagellimonas sp. S3867 TaxID=2768063 RepID=UPI001CC26F9D|nr:BatA domain-containing protein [Flagellimonas sp. S3867]